jgi:predicted nucleic acid-binding protein
MLMVDSSVWIDFLRGTDTPQVKLLARAIGTVPVLIGDLVYVEVMRGLKDQYITSVRRRLDAFEMRALSSEQIARAAVSNYFALRAKGITVRKTIDMIIGTYCILNKLPLLHADRDFEPLAQHLGLEVYRG